MILPVCGWVLLALSLSDPNAEPQDISFAEEILVTATAREEKSFVLPYSTYVLTGEDLRHRQMARTVPEALAEVPGVMVQATSQGQGSPYLRGFTGFRTLFLIDGIRLNNSVFREGPNQYWTTVDPLGLDQLEVVQGPASVLYGSDAIGGTVQALTFDPAEPRTTGRFAGNLLYRYASAEHSQGGQLAFRTKVGERWSLVLQGSAKDFGDVRAGEATGLQPKTGYGEWDGELKASYKMAGGGRLLFAHQQVAIDDAWRTHSTGAAKSFRGTAIGTDQERSLDQNRDLTYVQYHGSGGGRLFDGFSLSLSYQEQSEDEFRIRRNGARELQGFDVGTLGLWARWREESRRTGTWTWGLEAYRDEVDSFGAQLDAAGNVLRREIQGPVGDKASYDFWGGYVQNEARWSSRWSSILGTRWTGARATADRVRDPLIGQATRVEGSWSRVVGNVRVLLRLDPADRWHLFGGVSQGFRAPNLSDLSRFDSVRTNEREVAAPELDPEDFLSYEVGIKLLRPRLSLEAALYHTTIDGLIVRVPTGRLVGTEVEVTKRNAGDGFVHGIELRAEGNLHRVWWLAGSIAWLEGEVEIAEPGAGLRRQPLDKMMPATGRLALRWQPPAGRLGAELLWEAAARQDRLSPGDRLDTQRIPPGGTPGWQVLTLRGNWRMTERISLSGAVENVFDEDYRIHGSGVNRPGRSLVMGLEVRF
jgi:hemoglobin/transferrin/lactoferrin receptor protein